MSNYDTTDMQDKKCDNAKPATKYCCASCGVIQECDSGYPKSCVKCDSEKFYRVK